MIDATLNAVEDELTSIPFEPNAWRTDGRMYPAQDDAIVDVPSHPTITCFRHRAHRTYIGSNGSFEIQKLDGQVLLSKAGEDGLNVWTQPERREP